MIIRSEHSAQKRFAIVTRSLAQDKALSFQARGLLLYVLSKSEGWKAKDADIMKQGGIKKHAYASILNELKAAGYARRVKARKKGGTFTYSLEISEEPCFTPESPLPDNRVADKPIADCPPTESQAASIDSTCGGATDLPIIPKTDLRDTTHANGNPKPRKPGSFDERNDKSPKFGIELIRVLPEEWVDEQRTALRKKYPSIDFDHYHEKWCQYRFRDGGIGKRCSHVATLLQYAADLDIFFGNCFDNEQRRNGHNGANGKANYSGPTGNGNAAGVGSQIDTSLTSRIKRAW